MSFLLSIKAPKDKVPLTSPTGQNLSDLRTVVQNYLKEFVFVDLNDQPISKYYQANTPVSKSETVTIRFPTKQNTSKTQPVTRSQIATIDQRLNFRTLIKVGQKQTLSDARRHIVIPTGYQSFNFLNKSKLEISQISQNNYLVENILTSQTDKTMFITLRKSQVVTRNGVSLDRISQQETQGVRDKQQKTQATKAKVQDMIKQLDEFEKKFVKEVQDKNQLKQQKLKQISKRLDELNIPYSFKSSSDVGQVISELKKTTAQSQRLIDLLSSVKSYTVNQLASKAPELVGVGYYQGTITRQNPIDFALTQFEEDLSCNNLISVDFDYKSQQAQYDHLSTIQTKLSGGSFSAQGGTPFFFVRTGASYDNSNQYTETQKSTVKIASYFKNFYALFTGVGLRLTEDNLELKQIVLSKFQDLYTTKRSTANEIRLFEQQVLQFFSKYGDEVQIGSFYFGNTFSTSLRVEFQQRQSFYQAKKIAQTAMAMAVEGGGIFQGGFGAAKSAYDNATTSASSAQNEQLSSKYGTSAHQTSYPPVQNFSQWKEVVAVKNNYWKILGKNTKLVSLFKLLQLPNTIKRSILLKNQPIENIRRFLNEMQKINDTKVQTEQFNTRQFIATDFISAVSQMNLITNPAKIQNVIVKRTSGIHQISQVQSQQSFKIVLHSYLTPKSEFVMMVLSRSNCLFKEECKDQMKQKQKLSYQCIQLIKLVEALEVGLRKFTVLKTLTIYGRFYLYSTTTSINIAKRLNQRKLREYVIDDPDYKLKSDERNWTTYLQGAQVTWSAWK